MSGLRISFLEAGSTKHLEALSLRGGKFRTIRFPATVAVLEHPVKGVTLFDTGYSQRFHEATRHFPSRFYALMTPVQITPETTALAQLKARGIRADDVRQVVLSHFHADHIAGCRDFPKARFLYRGRGYEAVRSLGAWGALRAGFLGALLPRDFENRSMPLADEDFRAGVSGTANFERGFDLFGDASAVIVDLPGHACGQIGMLVHGGDGHRYFLVADAAWGIQAIRQGRPPSALVKPIFSDWRAYLRTLENLHQVSRADPGLRIVACHCEETLSHERSPHASLG